MYPLPCGGVVHCPITRPRRAGTGNSAVFPFRKRRLRPAGGETEKGGNMNRAMERRDPSVRSLPLTPGSSIFIAGHRGLAGSAIMRALEGRGCARLITRTHQELDLMRQAAVERFFRDERPEYVFLAAARVGGILANKTYPADFIYSNLMIQANVIQAAYRAGVKRLIFLGSSCIYPRLAPQPLKEAYLLTGPLEPTNAPYAVAKIAGIEMCEAYNRQYGARFLAVMPTNLYGPNDNFDLETSHVLPALIRKFHLAKLAMRGDVEGIRKDEAVFGRIPPHTVPGSQVVLWGSGSPFREFLHVDDMADACLFIMNLTDEAFDTLLHSEERPLVNIGCGRDVTIRDLAGVVKDVVGFEGEIVWDTAKPDGTPRKRLDISRLRGLGWAPKIGLREGIEATYSWYLENTRK